MSTIKRRSVVCGDDLVAHWPETAITKYHRVLAQCGAELSVGKHFIEPTRCCFTEKFFELKTISRKKPQSLLQRGSSQEADRLLGGDLELYSDGIKPIHAVPLKSLTDGGRAGQLPRWNTIGASCENLCGRDPYHPLAKRLRLAVRVLHKDLYRQFHANGIVPELPRFLGGAGIPGGRTLRKVSFWRRKALAAYLYGRSTRKTPQSYQGPWSSNMNRLSSETRGRVKAIEDRCRKVRPGRSHPGAYEDIGSLSEALERISSSQLYRHELRLKTVLAAERRPVSLRGVG